MKQDRPDARPARRGICKLRAITQGEKFEYGWALAVGGWFIELPPAKTGDATRITSQPVPPRWVGPALVFRYNDPETAYLRRPNQRDNYG